MPARLLILACGALANVLTALKRLNGWSLVDFNCLPANRELAWRS